jgi:hypothetical protein
LELLSFSDIPKAKAISGWEFEAGSTSSCNSQPVKVQNLKLDHGGVPTIPLRRDNDSKLKQILVGKIYIQLQVSAM